MGTKTYKVLQLGKHYPPFIGGTEKVIRDFTISLNEKGIRCDVLCANDLPVYEELNYGNYKVMKVPTYFRMLSTSFAPGMITKLREVMDNYEIIHVHMPDPMANIALLFSGYKKKLVLQWHMDVERYRILINLYKPILFWLFRRADVILVSSNALKEESEFARLMKNKVKIIPLGVNINELDEAKEDRIYFEYLNSIAMGRKIVLSVGRLVYYKGFDVLINSAELLPDNIAIFIVGDGPLKRDLEKMVNVKGLQGRVFLLGKLSLGQLVAAYKACHLFCLPSTHKTEAFGLVQLEAMYFGKPVVSTMLKGSGTCEVNIHGETGFCVKPGDRRELSSAILKILEDQNLYERLSQNARERSRKYDVKIIVDKLIDVYEELL